MTPQKLAITVALLSVASYALACAVLKWLEVWSKFKAKGNPCN